MKHNVDRLFKSEEDKLLFYLLHTDGQTRGDGEVGQDVSRLIERGLKYTDRKTTIEPIMTRTDSGEIECRGYNYSDYGVTHSSTFKSLIPDNPNHARLFKHGPGELVVDTEWFNANLSDEYENTRNVLSTVIKAGEWDDVIAKGVKAGKITFVFFNYLPCVICDGKQIMDTLDLLFTTVRESVPYSTDGIVIEVVSNELKDVMGSTSHHHRWQISYKQNSNFAFTTVTNIIPQVSRKGTLTPVVEIIPYTHNGVTISRATGHNYGNLIKKGIGIGAEVMLVRAGDVIPKIEKVVMGGHPLVLPTLCPSCDETLEWDGDNLRCINSISCPEQIVNSIEFFLKSVNVDGFGSATIEKIRSKARINLYDLFMMKKQDFKYVGFGDKESENMVNKLLLCREIELLDWKFLSAFGISGLGKTNSKIVLSMLSLTELLEMEHLDISFHGPGIGDKTNVKIKEGLDKCREIIKLILSLQWNIKRTFPGAFVNNFDVLSNNKMSKICVSGTFHVSRNQLTEMLAGLGYQVVNSVNSKTKALLLGENYSKKKREEALKNETIIYYAEGDNLFAGLERNLGGAIIGNF